MRPQLCADPLVRRCRRPLLWALSLLVIAACTPPQPGAIGTEVTGDWTGAAGSVTKADGTPAAGAFVYAYRSARNGLRGPADFGARVDGDGRYLLDLVEGDYHLVARLREQGADSGPPRPGDAWAIYPHNPVHIERNRPIPVDFVLQDGALPRQARQGSLTAGDTGFSGRLVDPDGRPLANAFALAYTTVDFHRMPELTSLPSDEAGRFTLYVPAGGIYCLAGRTKTRGQPQAGEPYGTLGQGDDACRSLRSGRIVDVGDIVLRPYR